jgi:hypothetical protein
VPSFGDIDSHWGKDCINELALKGILNGYLTGTGELEFRPDNFLKREEFAKIVVVAYNIVDKSMRTYFTDCVEGAWYVPYINALESEGLTMGIGSGMFGVDKDMSRQDTMTMLSRAMVKYQSVTVPNATDAAAIVETFTDADTMADYAKPAVAFYVTAGIVKGSETSPGGGIFAFRPRASITRAEISKIMNLTLDYVLPTPEP